VRLLSEERESMAGRGGNIALRPPVAHIRPYDGNPRKLREFKHKLNLIFAANRHYTEDDKIVYVMGLLSDDAQGWLMTQPAHFYPDSWEDLLTDMTNALKVPMLHQLQRELDAREYKEGESLTTYSIDVSNLCELLELAPLKQVSYYIKGLPKQLGLVVACQNPLTLAAAHAIACAVTKHVDAMDVGLGSRGVRFASLFQGDSGESRGGVSQLSVREEDDRMSQVAQQIEKLAVLMSKTREPPSGRGGFTRGFSATDILCSKCLQKGHFQRECPNAADSKALRCTFCTNYGHREADCRRKNASARSASHSLMLDAYSVDQLREALQEREQVSLSHLIDDGQSEGPEWRPIAHSGMFGLQTEPGTEPLPACQLFVDGGKKESKGVRFLVSEGDKKATEWEKAKSESDSESSFELTTSDEDSAPSAYVLEKVSNRKGSRGQGPRVFVEMDNIYPGGRSGTREQRTREEAAAQGNSTRASERIGVRKKGRMEREEEEAEERRARRKDKREQRRQSNYKLFKAVMGDKVELLEEIAPHLSYARKDIHTFIDDEVLHYVSRRRAKVNSLVLSSDSEGVSEDGGQDEQGEERSLATWQLITDAPGRRGPYGQLRKIQLNVMGKEVDAIVDTGSQISVVSYSFLVKRELDDFVVTRGAPRFTGSDLQSHASKGVISLTLLIGRLRIKATFTVVDGPSASYDVLLGQDILGPTYATVCNERREVRFKLPDSTYERVPFVEEDVSAHSKN
jgi:hypothetical protein